MVCNFRLVKMNAKPPPKHDMFPCWFVLRPCCPCRVTSKRATHLRLVAEMMYLFCRYRLLIRFDREKKNKRFLGDEEGAATIRAKNNNSHFSGKKQDRAFVQALGLSPARAPLSRLVLAGAKFCGTEIHRPCGHTSSFVIPFCILFV